MPQGDLLQSNVRSKLNQLKLAIKSRLAGEGIAWLVLALVGLVFVTLGLDYWLRLSRAPRIVLMLIGMGGVGYMFWRQLLLPLMVTMPQQDLALLVEKKWHSLQDRLISALQFSRTGTPPGTSDAMIQRVAQEANEQAMQMQYSDVIERRGLYRMATVSLASVLLLTGFSIWQPAVMGMWLQRNVMFSNVAWPQDTYLEFRGYATSQNKGRLATDHDPVVLRGDELELVVAARAGSIQPAKVVFHLKYPSLGMVEQSADLGDDGAYRLKLQNVQEEIQFYFTGGDDKLDKDSPHTVKLVNQPDVTNLKYQIEFPTYHNLSAADSKTIWDDVKGFIVVPIGSTVHLEGDATKDLTRADILCGDQASPCIASLLPRVVKGQFRVGGKNADNSQTLQFDLRDTHGYGNRHKMKYNVHVQRDKKPSVEVTARGVTQAVTANAQIPVRLVIKDDYGVLAAGVGIRYSENSPTSQPSQTASTVPAEGVKLEWNVPVGADPDPAQARFYQTTHVSDMDRLAYKPKVGDRIEIYVESRDNLPAEFGGPNVEIGSLEFEIVTPEAVRTDLTERQRVISGEFALAIQTQDQAVARIETLNEGLAEGSVPDTAKPLLEDSRKKQAGVDSEVKKAAVMLADILEEMKNNRVFSTDEHKTLGDIVLALRALGAPIAEADAMLGESMGLFRSGKPDVAALKTRTSEAEETQRRVLQTMKELHERMVQLESRQDIINRWEQFRTIWGSIMDQTKFLKEKGIGDIFKPAPRKPATAPGN